MKKCLHLPTVNTFSGCSVKSAWQTRFQMLQKCLLANVDDNLPWVPGTSKTCSKWKMRRLSSILLAMPLKNLVKLKRVIFVKPRVCIGCSVAQDRVGVGSMGPSVQLHHAVRSCSSPTLDRGNSCWHFKLRWVRYLEGIYLFSWNAVQVKSQKSHWYTVHCWFITIYTVLLQSMLFWCTLYCFIAICVAL